MTLMHETHIHFSGIKKCFGDKPVLSGLSLAVHSGQCILLSGNNGSGKTTLLRIMAGLETPDACYVSTGLGKCTWKQCLQQLRQTTVYLHQQPYMFDGDVVCNLGIPLQHDYPRNERKLRIESAIEWADLSHIARSPAKTLSGGERQRVAIARAWLRNPDILLLDEPMTNMDHDSRQQTIRLLLFLKMQGMALVVSSHDPVHFETLIDDWLHISNGRLHKPGIAENVTPIHGRKRMYESSH